tara:strand:- start:7528 stop:7632 length:105 start_codon:yes stop_codon:yes gene_type:complete
MNTSSPFHIVEEGEREREREREYKRRIIFAVSKR